MMARTMALDGVRDEGDGVGISIRMPKRMLGRNICPFCTETGVHLRSESGATYTCRLAATPDKTCTDDNCPVLRELGR